MSSKNYSRTIGIFGASGFIGESIIQRLARNNYKIKVASRNPYLSQNLRVSGDTAQIELTKINIHSDKSIQNFLDDCDVCINLIGILYEKSSQKFEDIHCKFPNTLSKIFFSSKHSKLLIHFSALGAKANSNSKYISTPYGSFLIKEFFSESLTNDEGEEVSTKEIKSILQQVISEESKRKPLTDDKLTSIFERKRV